MISIDGYPIDCVEQEQHDLQAEVTSRPVEDGENIADHVIIKPRELTLTNAVVSNTPIGAIATDPTRTQAASLPGIDAYNRLEAIFLAKQPVVVVTRRRKYDNMILDHLTAPDEAKTAGGLVFTAHFTNVVIAQNKRVTVAVPNAAGKRNFGTRTSSLWAAKFGIKGAIFVITFGHNPDGSINAQAVAGATNTFGPPILTDNFGAHFEVTGAARPDGYVKNKKYFPVNATGQDVVRRDQFGNSLDDRDRFGNITEQHQNTINGEPVNWNPEDRTWRDKDDNHIVRSYPPGATSQDFWKDVSYTPPPRH